MSNFDWSNSNDQSSYIYLIISWSLAPKYLKPNTVTVSLAISLMPTTLIAESKYCGCKSISLSEPNTP